MEEAGTGVPPSIFKPVWWGSRKAQNRLLTLLAFLVLLAGQLWGEKIGQNNGLGGDGQAHAKWAKNFYQEVFVEGLDFYLVGRILPAGAVHYGLRLLGVPLTDRSVIRGFAVLNLIVLTWGVYLWCRTTDQLRLHHRSKILGLLALFGNFAVLKWAIYYPVLTDVSGWVLGLAQLLFYLRQQRWLLLLVTVVGSFVWPTLMPVGALLLLFPREPGQDAQVQPAPFHLHMLFPLLMSVVLVAFVLLRKEYVLGKALNWTIEVIVPVLRLSLVVVVLYLFWVLRPLLNNARLFSPRYGLSRLCCRWGLLALVVLGGLRFLQYQAAVSNNLVPTTDVLVCTVATAIAKPGVFLLAHVLFFGPLLLLLAWWWPATCRLIHAHGVGLTLAVLLTVLLALNSESRRLGNLVPLIVPFLLMATEGLAWRPIHLAAFTGLSLLYSKVWLTLDTTLASSPLDLPAQTLFMTAGPWMAWPFYTTQGALVLITAYFLYTRGPRPAAAPV
jgi:hypothetical protein